MITVNVALKQPYDVIIGSGVLHKIKDVIPQLMPKAKKIAIITDDNVKALYFDRVRNYIVNLGLEVVGYNVAPGEAAKNSDNYLKIQNWLAEKALTSIDVIIALGGGVVGDLAGFVAATYMRGIAYIQIPTTLLAMVDSSVGGKTAIDLPAGKNLVGAFYQPALVLCDTDLLVTLNPDVMQDGYSEIIKYGMLDNKELLMNLAKDQVDINEVIAICVKMKRDIVSLDEFDKGMRKLLNFGHTIGHAIEQVSGYEISHGKAVAMGMSIDTSAAVKNGLCDANCLQILLDLLKKYELPSVTTYHPKQIYEAALRDKKREGDELTIIVPYILGICRLEIIKMVELYDWIKKGMSV